MKLEFSYGDYTYQYFLELLDRKSLSLIIKPDMKIVVRAPIDTNIEKIEEFLTRKWLWMEKQLKELSKYQKPSNNKEYLSGESYYYLGRQYMLDVRLAKQNKVKLERNKIVVFTISGERDYANNKKLLENWLNWRVDRVFKQQYIKAFNQFNYKKLPQLKFRAMSSRWGSCSKDGKRIFLNPKLIQASTEAIYYVCLHELCHVNNPKHDRKFYDLLESKMPDWRRVKNRLEIDFG